MPALEYQYKSHIEKWFYMSEFIYAPKLVSRTGHLTGLKIALIYLGMRVAFDACQWLAHAGHVDQLFFSLFDNVEFSIRRRKNVIEQCLLTS